MSRRHDIFCVRISKVTPQGVGERKCARHQRAQQTGIGYRTLTDSTKLVEKLVTVATVDPDIWRALRKVESITAFTMNIPASDAP